MVAKCSSNAAQFWRVRTCLMFVTYLALTCTSGQDVVLNGGFENDAIGPWTCRPIQCRLIQADEPRFGRQSIKTVNRKRPNQSPQQNIKAEPSKFYKATMWVKLMNDDSESLGQTLMAKINFFHPDDDKTSLVVARQQLITAADGWFMMEGVFQAPAKPFKEAVFFIRGPSAAVDFALDLVSITEIDTTNDDWRKETDDLIDEHRKSNIHLTIDAGEGVDRSKVEILVKQTSKSFPFGTAIDANVYNENQLYRDFIHQHFNWAVLRNALKWKPLERKEGVYRTDRVTKSLNGLLAHGLKVRGHNMLWTVKKNNPDWLTKMKGDQLNQTVYDHLAFTLGFTKGLLEHWDVYNEDLSNSWYRDTLKDRDYMLEVFREMYRLDKKPKLFLNNYGVVEGGQFTGAYKNQGLKLKNADAHLYGMGAQSHFKGEPNPLLIKRRLDILAEVGVPIWITEMDIPADDENARADWYEKALRCMYGHPKVQGILFWGFWGDIYRNETALATGPQLSLTKAGERVIDLYEKEWMTTKNLLLSQTEKDELTVRGFHGDYQISVKYDGHDLPKLAQTLTLAADKSVTITINPH